MSLISGPLVGRMLVLITDIQGIQFERQGESKFGPRMDNDCETSSDRLASVIVFTIDEYDGHVADIVGVLRWLSCRFPVC